MYTYIHTYIHMLYTSVQSADRQSIHLFYTPFLVHTLALYVRVVHSGRSTCHAISGRKD